MQKCLPGQTDKTGCFSAPMGMSTFNFTGHLCRNSINIVATVVEERTDIEANTTEDVIISSQMGSMTFEDTDNFYYPNFLFSGKIRVRGHGSSLKNHLNLEKAGLVTEEIRTRTVGFLEIRYRKKLTYKLTCSASREQEEMETLG
ncbi:Alpha-2-macroglobulin-like protein 1 [Tupaia chinensis]|uniref:Alpha-2-macroglobulin-like protein 1 n=1 Tax=Tupaia chinensis TaxID=246437 RepID=L9JAR6_TUPCH|nr:Alpha-2-macroglobulin-like protein 1 [Tupaia chinensis]